MFKIKAMQSKILWNFENIVVELKSVLVSVLVKNNKVRQFVKLMILNLSHTHVRSLPRSDSLKNTHSLIYNNFSIVNP